MAESAMTESTNCSVKQPDGTSCLVLATNRLSPIIAIVQRWQK